MNDMRSMTYADARSETLSAFMRGVYGWMTAGLGLTAVTALFTVSSPAAMKFIFSNFMVIIALFVVQIGLVVSLSGFINRMSAATATMVYLLYSALNGLTLSSIFVIYAQAAIFQAFFTCAGMFGAMSIYGMVTKRDLTSMGGFMFMGLIGIVIASLVNMFVKSTMMDFIISCVGVLVFVGLTAYDTQKLKIMGQSAPLDDTLALRRGSILGALTLYLDFINLFLMLLRLFGRRD